MKTTILCSMVVLGALPMAASAEEASSSFSWGEVTFQPRVYAGYADYSLKSGDMTIIPNTGDPTKGPILFGVPNRGKVDINGFIGGLGATVAAGEFFGDIYYQAIPSKTVYSAFSSEAPDKNIDNYGDIDAKHYDWAISLGYMITGEWAIFAGYKAGQTDADQTWNTNSPPPGSDLIQTGNYSTSFEQGGPFLGTSYSFPIGPGALTLKAAYAYLNGKYTSDFQSICLPSNSQCETEAPVLQQFTWKGNSNAYSLGVSWTQPITESFGFSVGANYHQYKFDASDSQDYTTTIGGIPSGGGVLEGGNLTEDLFTLTASLFYRF